MALKATCLLVSATPAAVVWSPFPGFEGAYELSNAGRLKSLKRKGVRQSRLLTQRPIVCLSQRYDYVCQNGDIRVRSRAKTFRISRLLREVFPEQHENAPGKRKVPPQVVEIRAKLAQGIKPKQIAADLGVSQATISRIRRGRTWVSPGEVAPAFS
jgi:transcriptional regulator with XRE-family HTH domain